MDSPSERTDLGRTEPWLRAVGFVIWLFTGLSRLQPQGHGGPGVVGAPAWLLPWLVLGVAYLGTGLRRRLPRRLRVSLLGVQSVAILSLTVLGLRGYEGLLLSIVAAQAPTLLSLRASLAWVLVQVPFLLGVVYPFKGATEMTEIVGAYATFSAFAMLVNRMHQQEVRARLALAHANAELLSTRALVLDGARQGERLRISRELHDSVGHHLTALSIQLELAQQLEPGSAAEPVARARDISREALGEVRRVVGEMQSPDGLDLVAQLGALAAGIPTPRIHVAGDEALRITDREASHALFRCVQEAITNSLRHAHASNVWVEVAQRAERLTVRVRDDGVGSERVVPGAGLSGMRARVSQLGGTVAFGEARGGGFQVDLAVPLDRVAR